MMRSVHALLLARLDDAHGLFLEHSGLLLVDRAHADLFVDGLRLFVGHVPLPCRLILVLMAVRPQTASQRGPARWISLRTSLSTPVSTSTTSI